MFHCRSATRDANPASTVGNLQAMMMAEDDYIQRLPLCYRILHYYQISNHEIILHNNIDYGYRHLMSLPSIDVETKARGSSNVSTDMN